MAHHVICMTVRKKKTVDLRFSPLKQSIETPRNSHIGPENCDIIIEGKRRYEQ